MDALRSRLEEITAEARRIAEAEASAAPEAILRRLISDLPVPALVADGTGRYVLANHAAALMTGYSIVELLRLSVWQLTPPVAEHEAEVLWRAFRERREQSGEYTLVARDGRLLKTVYPARADVLPSFHLSLLKALAR